MASQDHNFTMDSLLCDFIKNIDDKELFLIQHLNESNLFSFWNKVPNTNSALEQACFDYFFANLEKFSSLKGMSYGVILNIMTRKTMPIGEFQLYKLAEKWILQNTGTCDGESMKKTIFSWINIELFPSSVFKNDLGLIYQYRRDDIVRVAFSRLINGGIDRKRGLDYVPVVVSYSNKTIDGFRLVTIDEIKKASFLDSLKKQERLEFIDEKITDYYARPIVIDGMLILSKGETLYFYLNKDMKTGILSPLPDKEFFIDYHNDNILSYQHDTFSLYVETHAVFN